MDPLKPYLYGSIFVFFVNAMNLVCQCNLVYIPMRICKTKQAAVQAEYMRLRRMPEWWVLKEFANRILSLCLCHLLLAVQLPAFSIY